MLLTKPERTMRHLAKRIASTVAITILLILPVAGQSPDTTPIPAFEAATVKPNASGDMNSRIGIRPGGRFIATNVSLKHLIMFAYQMMEFQVSGGPGWVTADRFDVNTVSTENLPGDQVQRMLRRLLTERFALKLTRTTKDDDVLVLRVAEGGSKLLSAPDDGSNQGFRMDVRRVYSNPVAPISAFASMLSNFTGRLVIDRTELQGLFKIDLSWGRSDSGEPGPSIFTAVQQQLGLRLTSEKQPIDVIVIESAAKPEGWR
jgi:uncharacterized protein (TIGR03435 family)